MTALMNAAMEDHSVVVALLLAHKAKADPNKHDNVRNRRLLLSEN